MNCKQYWQKLFGESSIHGFPYLVRRELHWLERVFWAIVVILAAYFSIDICINQWKRFRDNPIVYAMELAWGKSNFPFVGITLCSNLPNQEVMDRVIQEYWNVTETQNKTQHEYYENFLKTLKALNYLNLDSLKPYKNDSSLSKLKFADILLALHEKVLPNEAYPDTENKIIETETNPFEIVTREEIYAAAVTEMGVCRTTSQLSYYTNPYGKLKSLKVSEARFCNIINECNTKIFPKIGESATLLIFLHNVEDIVTPYDKGGIMRHGVADGSLTIELLLSLTTAETEVRNLPIAYRKCRYKDENNLKYFKIYRPSLCRIECRINVAMKKCGCKPYFYAMAPHLPTCTIKGMVCLALENWPKVAQCKCPDLCEEETYVSMQQTTQKDGTRKFESTIIVKMYIPRMAIKRRVVFSTDQLIMSFGGAIGLFLGASFISVYGLLYVLFEYIFSNTCCRLKGKRIDSEQRIQAEKEITLVKEVY